MKCNNASRKCNVFEARRQSCHSRKILDLRKVKIQNASVFIETTEAIGFKKHDVILRPIPKYFLNKG